MFFEGTVVAAGLQAREKETSILRVPLFNLLPAQLETTPCQSLRSKVSAPKASIGAVRVEQAHQQRVDPFLEIAQPRLMCLLLPVRIVSI